MTNSSVMAEKDNSQNKPCSKYFRCHYFLPAVCHLQREPEGCPDAAASPRTRRGSTVPHPPPTALFAYPTPALSAQELEDGDSRQNKLTPSRNSRDTDEPPPSDGATITPANTSFPAQRHGTKSCQLRHPPSGQESSLRQKVSEGREGQAPKVPAAQ